MTFNFEHISLNDSIKIGEDSAPLKVVEYINLRCPDSKNYEENVAPFLKSLIQEGKVQRILKHFDKAKYGLEPGNLMNQFINYDTPQDTYATIQKLFKDQATWGRNRIAQIPHVAREYGLELQAANGEITNRVLAEVKAVNIENIPTVFVGETAFVETIELDDFKQVVENNL